MFEVACTDVRKLSAQDQVESLTAAGRAVSLLVAGGLTNGAVARRLYLSPRTVNTPAAGVRQDGYTMPNRTRRMRQMGALRGSADALGE
jgi:DNA-binding CsgD family transcriptional regulator